MFSKLIMLLLLSVLFYLFIFCCKKLYCFHLVQGLREGSRGVKKLPSGWRERFQAEAVTPEGLLKSQLEGFPGSPIVKNPGKAGDTSSTPGPGRSHRLWSSEACEPQLLSPWSRAHELRPRNPRAWSLFSTTRGATTIRSAHARTGEGPPCSNEDPARH